MKSVCRSAVVNPVMTRSVTRLTTTAEDHRIARLAAAAIGLALIDAAIPMPLPGVKPGLSNIVTLIVLARYGWGTAAWVCGLRVVAGSILLGQLLAPGFFMSLTGAIFSLLHVIGCNQSVNDGHVSCCIQVGDTLSGAGTYIVEVGSISAYYTAYCYDCIYFATFNHLCRAIS